MKLPNNDTVVHSSTSLRHSPTGQRVLIFALIAIPCLMIVYGLLIDPLLGSPSSGLPVLGLFSPVVMFAVSYSLLKSNPRLRSASTMSLQSYVLPVKGLDERERLVIDQAFRMSYRIIALIGVLTLACLLINFAFLNLTYPIGSLGILYIITGTMELLLFLPTAIVAWKEEI